MGGFLDARAWVDCRPKRNLATKDRVMELGLKDRVAIVTGASKGLGKAIALELAREGCKVVLCARGEDELEETAGEVREFGEALAVVADVTSPEDVENIVEETITASGT